MPDPVGTLPVPEVDVVVLETTLVVLDDELRLEDEGAEALVEEAALDALLDTGDTVLAAGWEPHPASATTSAPATTHPPDRTANPFAFMQSPLPMERFDLVDRHPLDEARLHWI